MPRKQLLLVSENLDEARELQSGLTGFGYEVTICPDSARAIEATRAGVPACGSWPDAVLLDTRSLNRHGFQLLRQLKEDADTGDPLTLVLATARPRSQEEVCRYYSWIDCLVENPGNLREIQVYLKRLFTSVDAERGNGKGCADAVPATRKRVSRRPHPGE